MKKVPSILLLGILLLCLNSCDRKPGHVAGNTGKDTVKTTPSPFALACSEEYNRIYNPEEPKNFALRQAYTESVSFYGPTVLDYMNSIDSLSSKDIYVVLGVYVDPVKYNETAKPQDKVNPKDYIGKVGRLTVFLWPRKRPGGGWGDCPDCDPPLNLGDLHP